MEKYHTICIGGGINSLVCAALLARAGKKVLVLEGSCLGGCIRSEQVEGCTIDLLSTAYPLFVTSPAYAALKPDLEKEGVEFIANDTPTCSVLSNKKFVILKTNREENRKNFNALCAGEGDAYAAQMQWVEQHAEFLFTILSKELYSPGVARFLIKYVWKTGLVKSLQHLMSFTPSVRHDLPSHFQSKELLAIMAPWVLHTGLSTESPFSATMSKIVAFTVETVGLPLIKGGSYKIVEALKNIIEKNGGLCMNSVWVDEIVTANNTVTGVKSGDITWYAAHVVANVTPTQLYQKLLKNSGAVTPALQAQVSRYKYGKGNMQIHLILKEKPKWFDAALDTVVYVHLTDGIDEVSKAVNEATRQVLPERGTICIAQPSAVDPSRATDGKYVLWIQLPECPNFPIGDAAGELNAGCQGQWTHELKHAYADRIFKRMGQYISNLNEAIIYKHIISPSELAAMNINLVNGDPYSGSCEINQYLLGRPVSLTKNHNTPVKNLYHTGASTHPGPGLGGVSGFLVGERLLKRK